MKSCGSGTTRRVSLAARWYPYAPTDQPQEAVRLYREILKSGVRKVGLVDTTEGIRWAKSLINDTRYRLGQCYCDIGDLSQSARYLRAHLKNRKRGQRSNFTRKEVLKKLEKTLAQQKHKK